MKKISIVTPVYNGARYIEKNILSIINQEYENYEHIIVDGCSTDETLAIAEKYAKQYPISIISEKDHGMYDAIEKGFKLASGDIMAWLNADDTYMPWAFRIMNKTISDSVQWCTGMNAWQNEQGIIYKVSDLYLYKREFLKNGYYDGRILRFVQQESTYWSKELWEKVYEEGMISRYKLAGDYHLWKMFANFTELYSVGTVIGSFRLVTGQKSENLEAYFDEVSLKIPNFIKRNMIRVNDFNHQYHGNNKIVYPIHENQKTGLNLLAVNPL